MARRITVRRLRVRGLEGPFESRILPLFVRRTEEVAPRRLYLHGLARGEFELALRGLSGEGAPWSPSAIGRLRAKSTLEYCDVTHAAARPARGRVRVGRSAVPEGGARGHEGRCCSR